MNTSSLKKFAVSAREKLMNGVADKILALGFDKKGNVEEKNVPQRIQGGAVFMERILNDEGFYDRWMSLYQRVKTIGIKEVVEEAAYTWFNRFIALRFMEVNGYLPSHVRVFTDDEKYEKYMPWVFVLQNIKLLLLRSVVLHSQLVRIQFT